VSLRRPGALLRQPPTYSLSLGGRPTVDPGPGPGSGSGLGRGRGRVGFPDQPPAWITDHGSRNARWGLVQNEECVRGWGQRFVSGSEASEAVRCAVLLGVWAVEPTWSVSF
jgi:hypothetical protein